MKVTRQELALRARQLVTLAIGRGDMPHFGGMDCVDCGSPAQCYDHRDYMRPLDVDPVCKPCDGARGAGSPPVDTKDIDIDWAAKPKKIRWAWGWIDSNTRIRHHWNVEHDVAVARCGIKSNYLSRGKKSALGICKKCARTAPKDRTARRDAKQ